MVTFCLMAEITANTVAKRDGVYDYIQNFLDGKSVWGNTLMSKWTSEDGKPSMSVVVRFNHRPNLDDLFQKAKDRFSTLTGVTITISKHICKHDTTNEPCIFEEVFGPVSR